MSALAHPTMQRRSGEARRAHVVAAARDLFLSKGFDHTSIKDITDTVGGSRRDIYEMFSDKEGLFEAVLQELIREILATIEVTFQIEPSEDIAEDLARFGTALLGNMLRPTTLTIFRQFVSIGAVRPDIGRQAFGSGPGVVYNRLASYFEKCSRQGRLRIIDAPATARVFVEMIKGDYQLRALMANETDFDAAELRRHVDLAVGLFLHGAGVR